MAAIFHYSGLHSWQMWMPQVQQSKGDKILPVISIDIKSSCHRPCGTRHTYQLFVNDELISYVQSGAK